ncbi:variant-surface-glycoprotein phospholipase C [Angomonas deanei]|nr:variant-surface-glycoprotein phospholipase C [Angomonas deanei]|eukprot:EPY33129.1 variant-surface-glycoprotein phospholipase C [Angomonas deanei]
MAGLFCRRRAAPRFRCARSFPPPPKDKKHPNPHTHPPPEKSQNFLAHKCFQQMTERNVPPWSPSSWMGDLLPLIGGLKLGELRMVGTHNSGTYGVKKSSKFGVDAEGPLGKKGFVGSVSRTFAKRTCSKWAKCQCKSSFEQVYHGSRYLDLRIVPGPGDEKNVCYISHTQLSVTLSEFLDDVKRFYSLPESKNEIIILDFQHVFLDNPEESLFRELNTLSSLIIPPGSGFTSVISDLLKQSGRIVVVMGIKFDTKTHPFIPRGAIVSRWKNAISVKDLLSSFDRDCEANETSPAKPGLYVTQGILTPNGTMIAKSIFSGKKSSLYSLCKLAEDANNDVLRWFWLHNYHKAVVTKSNVHANVLLMDIPESANIEVQHNGAIYQYGPVEICVLLNVIQANGS